MRYKKINCLKIWLALFTLTILVGNSYYQLYQQKNNVHRINHPKLNEYKNKWITKSSDKWSQYSKLEEELFGYKNDELNKTRTTPKGKVMIKIPRGTTGQADFVSNVVIGGWPTPGTPPDWQIITTPSGNGGTYASPNGWTHTVGGVIGVPSNATLGVYTSSYYYQNTLINTPPDNWSRDRLTYEFEVICMEAEVVLTYNGSDNLGGGNYKHYYSAVATPIGGTGPYTYYWTPPIGASDVSGLTASTISFTVTNSDPTGDSYVGVDITDSSTPTPCTASSADNFDGISSSSVSSISSQPSYASGNSNVPGWPYPCEPGYYWNGFTCVPVGTSPVCPDGWTFVAGEGGQYGYCTLDGDGEGGDGGDGGGGSSGSGGSNGSNGSGGSNGSNGSGNGNSSSGTSDGSNGSTGSNGSNNSNNSGGSGGSNESQTSNNSGTSSNSSISSITSNISSNNSSHNSNNSSHSFGSISSIGSFIYQDGCLLPSAPVLDHKGLNNITIKVPPIPNDLTISLRYKKVGVISYTTALSGISNLVETVTVVGLLENTAYQFIWIQDNI